MSLKRTNSIIEEEALLTRPSTPQNGRSLGSKLDINDHVYGLESPERGNDAEKESLLRGQRPIHEGKASSSSKIYQDQASEEDLALSDNREYPTHSPRQGRTGATKRRRKRIVVLATILIVIILGAVFGRPLLSSSPWSTAKESNLDDPYASMSNGTHEYKKTVLLVSIDGLRADYLDRGLTPHLIHISKRGLRAEWMKPAFPSLTFPNHWTLMTGLHPESHGIIGNNFYDPNFEAEFVYTDPARSHAGKWWGGEPVWETAAKGNLTTAVMMWPGPPTTSRGVSPTYFIPFDDDTKMFQKVSQIVEWLELPLEERPRLITVYEPSLDEAGHLTGPSSDLVRTVLGQVDLFAKDVHQALLDRNLTHIVDVIYVSDHGMTDTSAQRVIYLDEIIGEEGVNNVLYEDGWPNFGLRFKPSANASHYLSLLQQYSASHRPNSPFEVYTHETMPERYHFSNNDRIAPIYVCPRLGWVVTNHHEVATKWGGDSGRPKGTHGYDNDERDMRAMFVADGPFAQRASRRLSPRSRDAGIDKVIPGFPNLELYGLVTKILGLTPAPNNGTAGFWDQYF